MGESNPNYAYARAVGELLGLVVAFFQIERILHDANDSLVAPRFAGTFLAIGNRSLFLEEVRLLGPYVIVFQSAEFRKSLFQGGSATP